MSEEKPPPETPEGKDEYVWKDLVVSRRHMRMLSELARRRKKALKKALAEYIAEMERQGLNVSPELRERLRQEQEKKNLPP